MSTDYSHLLFQLLPAVHQIRDADQQRSLQNLMRVIGEHVQQVHDDITRLYDNWFIETCDDWVVPYIADLVGFRNVEDPGEPGDAVPAAANPFAYPRREVANTVRLRRRKGTLSVLEDLAQNVAGWPARAVEFGRLVLSTTHERFPELPVGRTFDFRDPEVIERIPTPFNSVAHLADFRAIQSQTGIGWYGPGNVGLFVWQRHIVPVTQSKPRCLASVPKMLFSLHPLGAVCPLHAKPVPETDGFGTAGETHLPLLLTRWLLATKYGTADPRFYGPGKSLSILERDGDTWKPIEARRVLIQDLSCLDSHDGVWRAAWRILKWLFGKSAQNDPVLRKCQEAMDPSKTTPQLFQAIQRMLNHCGKILVDPETGRLLSCKHGVDDLRATWHVAVPTLMGGGEYDREYLIPSLTEFPRVRLHDVPNRPDISLKDILPMLNQRTWKTKHKASAPAKASVKGTFIESSAGIELAASGTWTLKAPAGLEIGPNVVFELRARNKARPVIELYGEEDQCGKTVFKIKLHPGSRLVLDGLHVTGDALEITFCHNSETDAPHQKDTPKAEETNVVPPAEILISHSTIMPLANDCHCEGGHGPQLRILGERGRICISQSVIGGMHFSLPECEEAGGECPVLLSELEIRDSLLDAIGRCEALSSNLGSFASAELTITRSTVLGAALVQRMKAADDSLFFGVVKVKQRQDGAMRYCYLKGANPPGPARVSGKHPAPEPCWHLGESQTPKRFRCQPDLWKSRPARSKEMTDLEPLFYSTRYGHPGYGQLRLDCPKAISQGAESESEMGFTHEEYLPQRRSRLKQQLADFTPADMQSAIIYAEELFANERQR